MLCHRPCRPAGAFYEVFAIFIPVLLENELDLTLRDCIVLEIERS